MASTVFILNGPNLNLLGKREPEIYGTDTLADLEAMCRKKAQDLDLIIDFRQTNHEGVMVDWIQSAREEAAAIIINAAAYTHTSIAILDALQAFEGPIVEVHLSDIKKRESFRHKSFVSEAADTIIMGLGAEGYIKSLEAVADHLAN